MAIEIEKKFRLSPAQSDAIRASLEEFGAEYLGEDFEVNQIFGGPVLDAQGAVVRIRKIRDHAILTFKKRIDSNLAVKQQVEYESRVSDAENIREILVAVGLKLRLVYEKRRRKWKFRSVEVVLDELPFGLFMEIEGSLTGIGEAEMLLDCEDLEPEFETYPRLTQSSGVIRDGIVEARFEP